MPNQKKPPIDEDGYKALTPKETSILKVIIKSEEAIIPYEEIMKGANVSLGTLKTNMSRIREKDESLLHGVYGRGVESNFIGVEFKEEDGLIKFRRSDQEDL